MRVMGLDPSLNSTGYVAFNTMKAQPLWAHTHGILKNKYRGIERISQLAYDLSQLLITHRIELMVIEGYNYKGQNVVPLAEVGCMYRYACWSLDIPYIEVAPAALKSFVLGKGAGKGEKNEIMRAVYKRWRFEGNNDECDAYALGMFGLGVFTPIDMPIGHMEAVKRYKIKHLTRLQLIAQQLQIEYQ